MSVVIGFFLAWMVARTNTPFRRFFEIVAMVPYMIPGILFVVGWIFIASPRIGIVNMPFVHLLGLEDPPFNIFSLAGLVWITGLNGAPLAFLLISSAFQSMDPALEEASGVSGAGIWHTLIHITTPLVRPAILATFILNLIRALARSTSSDRYACRNLVFDCSVEEWFP